MTVKTRGKPQTTHTYQTRAGRAASTTNDQNTPDDCANASATRVHMTAHYHQACTGERFKSTQGHQTGGQQQKYTHRERTSIPPAQPAALRPRYAQSVQNRIVIFPHLDRLIFAVLGCLFAVSKKELSRPILSCVRCLRTKIIIWSLGDPDNH